MSSPIITKSILIDYLVNHSAWHRDELTTFTFDELMRLGESYNFKPIPKLTAIEEKLIQFEPFSDKVIHHLNQAKDILSEEISNLAGFGLIEDANEINRIHDMIEDTVSTLNAINTPDHYETGSQSHPIDEFTAALLNEGKDAKDLI